MPQARRGGSRRTSSSAGSRSGRSSSSRSTASRSTGRKTSAKSTRAKSSRSSTSRGHTSRGRSASTRGGSTGRAADARVDAVAKRVRRLNDRIIDAGKEAGEATLTSYERALKAIAATIEKGPGSSDIEWVSNLATAQAKFIRDLTTSWAKTARRALR